MRIFRRAFRAVKLAGCGRPKGYCLLTIDRAFGSLLVPKARLKNIGWTKLNLLTKHTMQGGQADLLELAEQYTAIELAAILRGSSRRSDQPRNEKR